MGKGELRLVAVTGVSRAGVKEAGDLAEGRFWSWEE